MWKKFIAILLIFGAMPCMMGMTWQEKTDKQAAMHEIAEIARANGISEDDPLIQRASELWWEAEEGYTTDRDIIATVIYNEAWGGCSDRHRELVAAVICNRVASDRFPNTVYDVVCAPRQYLPAYADPNSKYGLRARADADIWAECQRIADKALKGEIECDSNVLYQANFTQGTGVYETHRTSYSVSYFCYG